MNAPNKKGFRLGGGRNPITKDIEANILIWLYIFRRNSISISGKQIITCGIKLNGGDFKLT